MKVNFQKAFVSGVERIAAWTEKVGGQDHVLIRRAAVRLQEIVTGAVEYEQSVLHHAPHTAQVACGDEWNRPYTREQAAFAAPWLREHKFFATVGRVDNAFGDRNLVCTCPTVEELAASTGA